MGDFSFSFKFYLKDYFSSTLTPASSSFFFASSASSFFAFSKMVTGAFSTRFFASTNPKSDLISLSALIAAILLSPAAVITTSYSVFSSASASAAAGAAAPATATGAAETPNFSSKALTSSDTSSTESFEISSIILSNVFLSAMNLTPSQRDFVIHNLSFAKEHRSL